MATAFPSIKTFSFLIRKKLCIEVLENELVSFTENLTADLNINFIAKIKIKKMKSMITIGR